MPYRVTSFVVSILVALWFCARVEACPCCPGVPPTTEPEVLIDCFVLTINGIPAPGVSVVAPGDTIEIECYLEALVDVTLAGVQLDFPCDLLPEPDSKGTIGNGVFDIVFLHGGFPGDNLFNLANAGGCTCGGSHANCSAAAASCPPPCPTTVDVRRYGWPR